jgi:hypothetical protein
MFAVEVDCILLADKFVLYAKNPLVVEDGLKSLGGITAGALDVSSSTSDSSSATWLISLLSSGISNTNKYTQSMYMFAYLLSVLFNDIKVPFTLRRSCD